VWRRVLERGKEAWFGTWEGGMPLFKRRGERTRNVLRGRRLPSFALALAARAEAEAACA